MYNNLLEIKKLKINIKLLLNLYNKNVNEKNYQILKIITLIYIFFFLNLIPFTLINLNIIDLI
jgi:hypothetical protein